MLKKSKSVTKYFVFAAVLTAVVVGVFASVYSVRIKQIDNESKPVTKDMIEEMDENKIEKIKIVADDSSYDDVESFAKVAKSGDIVKCNIQLASGEKRQNVDGYVVNGEHTGCKLEGNLVKITIEGVGIDVGK